jgi:hypothetical protein
MLELVREFSGASFETRSAIAPQDEGFGWEKAGS